MVLAAACTMPSPSASPSACPTAAPTDDEAPAITAGVGRARMETSMGTMVIELYPDAAPIATANFVALARCGFYDGITFHRVIAGFVIQAGDPQTKTNRGDFGGLGTGGPGYQFEVEFPAEGLTYEPYVVAMANSMQYDASCTPTSGTDTNGSQFFIDLVSLVGQLCPNYTILGKVVEGTGVVDAIGQVAVNNDGVPDEPVVIGSITLESGA